MNQELKLAVLQALENLKSTIEDYRDDYPPGRMVYYDDIVKDTETLQLDNMSCQDREKLLSTLSMAVESIYR